MKKAILLAVAAGVSATYGQLAPAAVFNLPAGGSWNVATNWTPNDIPNSAGENATFNSAAQAGVNPAQTGSRTVTLDAAQTVGSVNFNNDAVNAFNNSITAGTGGSLTFDEGTAGAGGGPATITVNGITGATGNNTISGPIILTDSVVATVNNVTATSAAGALNLTAAISGAGGFTKSGDGLATFGTGAKTYTGASVFDGGRTRISLTASPTATSSFTISPGGQVELLTAGSYTFGPGNVNIGGVGATSGPFAAFPGALRPSSNLAITITNNTVLTSQAQIVSAGTPASSSITFSGIVSGSGSILAGGGGAGNTGTIALNGTNSYSGGSTVNQGTLQAGASSVNAFGTGNVTVDNFAGAPSNLSILSGAVNAIDDAATLDLDGGGTAGIATLGAGINEFIGGLILGGVTQTTLTTYGSTSSPAMIQNDNFFSGPGVVTLVPEPTTLSLLVLGAAGLLARRRRA